MVPLVDVLQLMLPPMLLDKSRFVGWQVRYLTQPNSWPLQTKLTPHLHTMQGTRSIFCQSSTSKHPCDEHTRICCDRLKLEQQYEYKEKVRKNYY